MAIVTRYFSTSGAGDADGTSWANRAALFDGSGNWSSVITGFDFSGSDYLECYVQGGLSYTWAQAFAAAAFTTAPTITNMPVFKVCDSNGDEIASPAAGWVSAQPVFSSSTMPILTNTTTNGYITAYAIFNCFKFVATNRNSYIFNFASCNDCIIENSTSGTSAAVVYMSAMHRCVMKCSGGSYAQIASAVGTSSPLANCRLEGNASASSGNRYGILDASYQYHTVSGCTIIGNVGGGIVSTSTVNSQSGVIENCTIVDNDGSGIACTATASQTSRYIVGGCLIVNNGAYGIDVNASNVMLTNSRLRNNTTANISAGAVFGVGNNESAGTDANEFVDYDNGDYRIKASSSICGKGYGAGDELATGGSGGGLPILGGSIVR